MKHKTLIWAVLLGVLAAASLGVYVLRGDAGGKIAEVYVEGKLYDTVDLSAVAVPYEITVKTEYGYNVLLVQNGAIEVDRADCSEQICVNQGAITDGLIPITCLPHRVVIRIVEDGA